MRPRLLDLFCGAGGAAVGYHRAGFDIVGVDINPQPHYPFEFHQADALTYPLDGFDAIHASPPCQAYTTMSNRHGRQGPDLLPAILERFNELDVPWIIENVVGAKRYMPNAFMLTGRMFGLRVHRPRYFASNVLVLVPAKERPPVDGIGVYGKAADGRQLWKTYRAASSLVEAQQAMGMDWADWHGVKEAIPPAYTEHIGHQLLQHLELVA